MKLSRASVGVLGGAAAGCAGTVGAVSLTRIAGDYLGFPPGLEWTLTAAVDVAGIAGGVMWTAFSGDVRRIGRPMNIVCTVVSGVGVGLDHAANAGRALRGAGDHSALPGSANMWPYVAFSIGVFVPILATWILHALSIIADNAGHQTGTATSHHLVSGTSSAHQVADTRRHQVEAQPGSHQPGTPGKSRHQAGTSASGTPAGTRHQAGTPPLGKPDHQAGTPVPGSRHQAAAPVVVETQSATSYQVDARPAGQQLAKALPPAALDRRSTPTGKAPRSPGRASLASVPFPRRPWMTNDLLDAAITAVRDGGARYGRKDLMSDLKVKDWQARDLLRHIKENDLTRRSA